MVRLRLRALVFHMTDPAHDFRLLIELKRIAGVVLFAGSGINNR